MPKVKLPPIVEDVPIWDTMIAEFGDPRPHEPIEIGHVIVTDEPCVDVTDCDDALNALRVDWEEFDEYCDALLCEADDAMDEIWAWPLATRTPVADPESTIIIDLPKPTLRLVGDVTQEIPVITSINDDDNDDQ